MSVGGGTFGRLSAVAVLILLAAAGEAACVGEPQSVAVPSYFPPGQLWDRLEEASPAASVVVINPNSGPGTTRDAAYADRAERGRAAGLTVLGYVYTGYGSRDVAAVKADIDRYYEWYGVGGVFLDEASTDCALASSYYKDLYDHVKSKNGEAMVAINPGIQTRECYMTVADTIVNFEDTHRKYTDGYSAPGWVGDYAPGRFWHLVYDAPNSRAMEEAVRLSKGRNAGYVYVTPDTMPNPWDTLPPGSYWQKELSAVR